jgi:hypothetical protein
VKDADNADLGSQVLGIGLNLEQGLNTGKMNDLETKSRISWALDCANFVTLPAPESLIYTGRNL